MDFTDERLFLIIDILPYKIMILKENFENFRKFAYDKG